MDSALRPREIQARIRAGQSLEEVARIAGVPAERIEAYAAPVLAEREHVAGLALAATIRRHGESGAHRTLRPVVRERLTSHQVDPDTVHWDAWRNEDRRWSVRATWIDTDELEHAATFYFDLRSRFSIPADDEARWLIAPSTTAEPSADEDSDELALVRAVSPTFQPADDTEATIALPEPDLGQAGPTEQAAQPDERPDLRTGTPPAPEPVEAEDRGESAPADFLPRSAATPLEIGEAVEAEIDSYGVIPEGRSELDVLYDMLGGIAEDSINIYAGLSDPVVPESIGERRWDPPPEPSTEPGPAPAAGQPPAMPATAGHPERASAAPPKAPEPPRAAAPEPPRAETPESPRAEAPESARAGATPTQDEPAVGRDQPALTDDAEATVPLKPGAAKRRRKGRAQVPSWEEIMFGSPKAD